MSTSQENKTGLISPKEKKCNINATQFGTYVTEEITRTLQTIPNISDISSITFSAEQIKNVRDDFYLKIIKESDAKERILEYFKEVLETIEQSQQFERYLPSEDNPIYVFNNGVLLKKITTSIVTIGTREWNDIVYDSDVVSRCHAILMFIKNKNNELIMMIIDGWSRYGTWITNKINQVDGISVDNRRHILLPKINCGIVYFGGRGLNEHCNTPFIFLPKLEKICTYCGNNDKNVEFKCGHSVVCLACFIRFKTKKCSICGTEVKQIEHRIENVRDNLYSTITEMAHMKTRLLTHFNKVIEMVKQSYNLEQYTPTEDNPIYVFGQGAIQAKITTPIATIGSFVLNNIVSSNDTSRVHALLLFLKDKNTDLIMMMIIDGWSKIGTLGFENEKCVAASSIHRREIMLLKINCTYVRLTLGSNESYTFFQHWEKKHVCSMVTVNDPKIRFNCGHTLCSKCLVDWTAEKCAICEKNKDVPCENLD